MLLGVIAALSASAVRRKSSSNRVGMLTNLRPGQTGNGIIGYIAGLGDQDLITGIDHRADHMSMGLRAADGDHGLLFGIGKSHAAFQIAVDLLLEFPETGVG